MHDELQVGYHLSKPLSLFMHISITSPHFLKLFSYSIYSDEKQKQKIAYQFLHSSTPSTTLLATTILFSICMSWLSMFLFVDYICKRDHTELVFLCLTYLTNIMPSRSTHVTASGKIPFFSVAESYDTVDLYHNLLIQPSIDRHLGCISAIVNGATTNTGTSTFLD